MTDSEKIIDWYLRIRRVVFSLQISKTLWWIKSEHGYRHYIPLGTTYCRIDREKGYGHQFALIAGPLRLGILRVKKYEPNHSLSQSI